MTKKDDIRWNYAKFLIDSEGKPFKRYNSLVTPLDLRDDIEFLLGMKEKIDAQKKAKESEKKAKEMLKKVKEAEKNAKIAENEAAKQAKVQKKLTKKFNTDKTIAEKRFKEAEAKIKEAEERIQDANIRSQKAKELIKDSSEKLFKQ